MLFYDGTKPSAGAAITTQNLAGTLTLTYPCGTITNQTLTVSVTGDFLAALHTTITWTRVTTSADVFCMDLDVSDNNGSGAVKIDSTEVFSGGTVRLLSAAFSN